MGGGAQNVLKSWKKESCNWTWQRKMRDWNNLPAFSPARNWERSAFFTALTEHSVCYSAERWIFWIKDYSCSVQNQYFQKKIHIWHSICLIIMAQRHFIGQMFHQQEVPSTGCVLYLMFHPPDASSAGCFIRRMLHPPDASSAGCFIHRMLHPPDASSTRCFIHRMLNAPDAKSTGCYIQRMLNPLDAKCTGCLIQRMKIHQMPNP